MFCDVKSQLEDPSIILLMAYSEFECSLERAAKKAKEYLDKNTHHFYGWIEHESVIGICGFFVHENRIEITSIAVHENERGRGIGSAMISALLKKYGIRIEAETDDDAVGFYIKCGFETTAIQKHGVRRWVCILAEKAGVLLKEKI